MTNKFDGPKFNRPSAAKYLGTSIVTLDRAVKKRQIGRFQIGRRIVFAQEHLDEYLRSKENPPISMKFSS